MKGQVYGLGGAIATNEVACACDLHTIQEVVRLQEHCLGTTLGTWCTH